MSITLITVVMFSSMILLLLTGRQIFIIIGAVGTIAALALWGPGGENMPFIGGYSFLKFYPLMAIGPFVFMGMILSKSGIADKLFEAVYLWMRRLPGGLGIGTIGICCLIAAISGTNVTATITSGTIAMPAMLKRKYDKRMVTGLIQAGGALGFLIPPSVVFIIYGIVARVSIGRLWMAGILPGLLLAGMYIAYIGIRCRLNPQLGPPVPEERRVTQRERLSALRAAVPPIVLIFLVLGLFFMGVTTLVECSAFGAVGALAIAAMNRTLTRPVIREAMDETLAASSMIMWIFAAAILFSAIFDGLGAVYVVERLLGITGGGPMGTIIMMMVSFLLMGMVLDDTAMLLIVAPIYIPLVANLGYDLVWFGVLYTVNCQMAMLTPPFGFNLFIMRGIVPKDSGITMGDIYRSIIPFVGIQAAGLAIIMFFPQIALWLPSVYFGS